MARAQLIYGQTAVLPEPVVVQAVATCGQWWHFMVLQLNAVSLDSECGVRNMVWWLPGQPLFQHCDHVQGLVGYNPEVYQKVLALLLNGAVPPS